MQENSKCDCISKLYPGAQSVRTIICVLPEELMLSGSRIGQMHSIYFLDLLRNTCEAYPKKRYNPQEVTGHSTAIRYNKEISRFRAGSL